MRFMDKKFNTSSGFAYPLGPTVTEKGVNFAVFSKHATAVSLCIFKSKSLQPVCEIVLDPIENRTGDIWHIFVENIPHDYHYGYRVDGPYDPSKGHYFDNRYVLIDPYAKQVHSEITWGKPFLHAHPHIHTGVVNPLTPFDWGDDKRPNTPLKDLIIYEMHVRGYTQDPSSQVKHPGTFLGMIEKIPHLKKLGVNAVELLPIHFFNENENLNTNPVTGEPLYQFWGYSTVNFFSPMNCYGTKFSEVINEFKTLVKALHAEGIEVILDVVYNHTAEGNQDGPTLSFRGLENSVYYMLTPAGEYYNFTGCGNTVNANHPVVRDMIRDSLRYWVTEMHVDGFRFDLASILTRAPNGAPLDNPPLIEALSLDPILSHVKLIAEAWDAGGLYQVGNFPGFRVWADWNGKYRDATRRFIKGSDGEIGQFATRISGSEDLYGNGGGGSPSNSINFVTAHDGFTLADLVSYNEKHNEMNGEENRDGSNDNDSWNCGVEGPTEDEKIIQLRNQQMRNLHLSLMISQGVPMVLMGDEYAHTKLGNNNTWGHDTRINWFQWDNLEQNEAFFRFYRMMIDFRKTHPVLSRSFFLKGDDVIWHGKVPLKQDWNPKDHLLALTLPDTINHYELYIAFNASHLPLTIDLPKKEHKAEHWLLIVDTSKPSPEDINEEDKAPCITQAQYILPPYSSILLKSHTPKTKKKKH